MKRTFAYLVLAVAVPGGLALIALDLYRRHRNGKAHQG